MDLSPQTISLLQQTGYFGLLILLALWVKGHVKKVGDECAKDKESLLKDLTSTREQYISALTSTIEKDTASRDRATQSHEALTRVIQSLPCGKWDGKTDRRGENHVAGN